ncbi:ubiquitin-associated protein 2-like isoform X2 [Brienomyrus brachyistius]|uniref:ubiquitin-associated protein 2-like isoform X2 n=1 Tax=Brienomyrus brachyistius TaxID=42636 RepID=UPI0020B1D3BC|nr:ubiquitin-associated protein 2-like isoform X2 [Brienomyrus brachyistius]
MMTSVGHSQARTSLEATQSQAQTKQRPQATAEQIRLAQMISDCSDTDFEEKVKQLVDITGKNQDESMIALHDCNGDVNRAINVLLEGNLDTDSWEMVGKKKSVSGQKEIVQAEENGKDNRNHGGEKETARRRGAPSRRGRGTSRGREGHAQENGLDGSKGPGVEHGRRGKYRGRGGPGRRGGRFSALAMGQSDKGTRYDLSGDESTFNPADYREPTAAGEASAHGGAWDRRSSAEPEAGNRLLFSGVEAESSSRRFDTTPATWRTATEDWAEDMAETKVFTAASVASVPPAPPAFSITAGQRIDLAVLLGKPTPSSSTHAEPVPRDASRPPAPSQPLVFSSSQQSTPLVQTAPNAPCGNSMAGLLSKSFGEVGEPKTTCTGSTSGPQFLEQYKMAQALVQLAAQHTQIGSTGPASSWETRSSLEQYDRKSKLDPLLRDPFTKHPAYQSSSTSASSVVEAFLQDKPSGSASLPPQTSSVLAARSLPPVSRVVQSPGQQVFHGSSSPQLQQHRLRQQKKKSSLSTKIPSLAVEMPASADMSGLSLQFGALQFGSEPVIAEYDSTPARSSPCSQVQTSLYSSASSESAPSLSSQDQGYEGGGAPFPPQAAVAVGGAAFDQRATQNQWYPTSVSSSPKKDIPPMKNGFNSRQTVQVLEAAAGPALSGRAVSDSVSPPPVSSTAPLMDGAVEPHGTPMAQLQHSTTVPTQQSGVPSSSSSSSSAHNSASILLNPSVDSESGLHSSFPSSVSMSSANPPLSTTSAVSGLPMTLGVPLASSSSASSVVHITSTTSSSRSLVASSGKVPANLPPGVPPLLPNPYMVNPGLLHPYPPQVYGYDDLQMLQTRFPLDYYSIPVASPTAALAGREGSLASSPYSAGELSKFGRGDTSSPAPANPLPQTQQAQAQHGTQQPFLSPALPPGYSYTSLPYYTGLPSLASPFQYSPAVFPVTPASSKQHSVNVGVGASARPFQQPSGYSSHGYGPGYEELGQTSGSGEFCKGGYGSVVAAAAASAQGKPASTVSGPGVGVSIASSNTGVPDISGSVYTKTQSLEKPAFHAAAAAPFGLPSALGSGGPISPASAAAYPAAPFMHVLTPHQQPYSQILHHHLQQDAQGATAQRTQGSSIQQKSQGSKSAYSSYSWGTN